MLALFCMFEHGTFKKLCFDMRGMQKSQCGLIFVIELHVDILVVKLKKQTNL